MLNVVEFLHLGHSLLTRFTSIGIPRSSPVITKEIGSNYLSKFCKIRFGPSIVMNFVIRQKVLNIIKNKKPVYFVISATTRSFIESLVDYYTSEAASYKQMAKSYSDMIGDPADAAFGIIIGSIYSAFIQSYTNQQQKPSVEDIQEFSQIIKKRAPQIKRSIIDAKP